MRVAGLHVTFVATLLLMSCPRSYAEEGGTEVAVRQEPRHRGETPKHEEQEEEGIVNWWSLDYGPNAKDLSHRGWPPPFGFALINFALFAALIGRLAGPPLKEFLRNRHHRIRHDLDEASRLRKEAEVELEQYRQKVAGIDRQVEELLSGVRKDAEAEKARLIAAAESEAGRLKAEAERQIHIEVDRARLELRQQVVESASRVAEELLRKKTSAEDQSRMAEQFVGRLEQSNLPEKRA
jgi:F-type H+-transporting ATPase subunit b